MNDIQEPSASALNPRFRALPEGGHECLSCGREYDDLSENEQRQGCTSDDCPLWWEEKGIDPNASKGPSVSPHYPYKADLAASSPAS